jgi:hypothetical protein
VRYYLVRASNASRFDMELIYWQSAERENSRGAIEIFPQRTQQIDVEHGNRTWSDQTINAGVGGPGIDPSAARKQIASGQFASVVKTKLNGRAVIKLTIPAGFTRTPTIELPKG